MRLLVALLLSALALGAPRASAAPAIVVLGDSLSARRPGPRCWPDRLWLQHLLAAGGDARTPAIVNRAISGNRLLRDGWGPSGLSRLDEDVLAEPGLAAVVVLLGTNDLAFPQLSEKDLPGIDRSLAPAEALAEGLAEVVRRVRARGARAVVGTVPPFGGAPAWSPAAEGRRQALNFWIRESAVPDAVIDFDAALRDPSRPERLLPAYDGGDRLHPGEEGLAAMARAALPVLSALR